MINLYYTAITPNCFSVSYSPNGVLPMEYMCESNALAQIVFNADFMFDQYMNKFEKIVSGVDIKTEL